MDSKFPPNQNSAEDDFVVPEEGPGEKAARDLLKSYFTESQIEDGLQNASKTAITEYMKAIDPTLSEIQRTTLINFFKELNQNVPPTQAML